MENHSPVAFSRLERAAEANSAFGPSPRAADTTAFGAEPMVEAHLSPSSPGAGKPLKTWLAGGLAAAVFGIGGFFGVQALTHHSHATTTAVGPGGGAGAFPGQGPGGPGGPGGGGTFGTIKSINGNSLTLTTGSGSTLTVSTSSSTTVTNAAAGSVSDMKAGDHIAIRGTTSSGALTADVVTDTGAAAPTGAVGGPPGGQDVSGVVASTGNGSFTVTETGGTTVTVRTTASTNVILIQPSAVSALSVGDAISVTGTTTNGTVAATSIASGATGFGAGPGGAIGGPPNAQP